MADNQMVKIVFDFDLGNVPASAKKLSQYLKDNSLDLKFTKASVDGLSASLNQLATAQTKAGTATAAAGNSVKKSNMQWTHLALIVQDLPYGFRGIQNNLPALIGGFAGMTGAIYLASSVIIALFTAWDNGMISFGKSSKMAEDYSKGLATTYSTEIVKLKALYNISTDVTKSMGSRLEAAKALKEEYPGLLGKYSDEDIALGKAKSSYDKLTTTIINYSRAKAAEGILTGIAAERLPLEIERTELLAKQRKAAGKDIEYTITSEGKRVAIGNKSVRLLKENAEAQAKINKKAAPYVKILEDTAIAEIELEKFRAKAVKGKTSVGTLEDPNIKLLQAKQKYYKDDLLMSASFEQEILGKQRDLAVKQAELEKKSGTYIQTIKDTYNQLILNSQAETGRIFIEQQHKLGVEEAKEHEKVAQMILNTRLDLASSIAKINSDFAKEDIKNVNAELSATLKATKGNYNAQANAIQLAVSKLTEYRDIAKEAGYGTKEFDDAIKNLGFSLEGLVDPIEQMKMNVENALKDLAQGALVELGVQLGNVLSGGQFSMEGFMDMMANAIIEIGKHLIIVSGLFAAVDKLFKNPSTWPLAIAVGVAAIAVGTSMKNNAAKRNPVKKFADGGIISGPTMGLMGEYPGARTNPEVVAPLDKLKDMIGGGGGGTFMLRGQDLLLSVNRAQKASNLKGQNISLA
jgi:hypothetical protein